MRGDTLVLYFSGTGNSEYCAKYIHDQLDWQRDDEAEFEQGCEIVNSFDYIKSAQEGRFTSNKPWIFVAPTYCWQLPHIFENFIRESSFEGSKDAYFIMTCGSDIGNAKGSLERLCQSKGFRFMGVAEIIMPENYIAMFSVPDKEESERIVSAAGRPLKRVVRQIQKGETIENTKVTFIDKIKTGALNPVFYKLFVKAKAFYTTENCIGCGKCADLCPTNNIMISGGRPVWRDKCTHCMACICRCPAEAVEYGRKSLGKPRYTCVEYDK